MWHTGAGEGRELMHVSTGFYFTYREENRVFEDVALWDDAHVTVTGMADPERVDALLVTQTAPPLLGVRPVAGRLFTVDDDAPSAPPTVALGYGYWQRHFGGDPTAVGRTLTVDLATTFRDSSPSFTRVASRSRDALAVAQVALALLLLIGSGLMVRSVRLSEPHSTT